MNNAVVFDLDGTLLDTLASLAQAFNLALSEMGCGAHKIESYRHIIGDGARVAAIRALPPGRQNESDIHRCVTLFQANYQSLWQTAECYAGIRELITTLRPQIPMAVLSNKDQVFTQQCCDYFFPGVFKIAVGFSDTVLHKPHTSGAELIARELATDMTNLWMIGDTATDMKTAVAAGMTGVGVLWGFRDRAELENSGASHIIDSPAQLPKLMGLKESTA